MQLPQLGFFLGLNWDDMKQLPVDSDPASSLDLILKTAIANKLPIECLAQALYLLGNSEAQNVCKAAGLPSCDQLPTTITDHSRPLTAAEALLTIRKAGISCRDIPPTFGIEMGLSVKGYVYTQRLKPAEGLAEKECKLCSQLQEEGLLSYERLISTLASFQPHASFSGTPIPRMADYRVFTDKKQALTQPLSLRDLVDFIPQTLEEAHLKILGAKFTDCPGILQTYEERVIYALANYFQEKDGQVTANDICRFLCHPLVNHQRGAEHILATLTGTQAQENKQLTPLSVLDLSNKINNPELLGKHLNIPEQLLQETLHEYKFETSGEVYMEITIKAGQLNLLTPGNFVHALEQMELGHLTESVPALRGVVAQPIAPLPQPYLTDQELGLEPEATDTGMAPQSIPLTIDHCRLCNPGRNWFRTAMAMGLSMNKARLIETKHPRNSANALDEMWRRLLAKPNSYETGHLASALAFLDDKSSLAQLPEWMKHPPQKALADVSEEATQSYGLLFVSECLAPKAREFGELLGLPKETIQVALENHLNDSSQAILKMIKRYTSTVHSNNKTLMTTLAHAIETLTGDQSQSLRQAIEKTLEQQAVSVSDSQSSYKRLVAYEQSYQQNLEAIINSFIDIPDRFRCPITQNLIQEPVSIQQGDHVQVYEKEYLYKWVTEHHTNPMTREELEWDDVQEQPDLRIDIQAWMNEQAKLKKK